MYFIFHEYTEVEQKIFNALRLFFQKLPPIATDDYENGFFDIVAQYAGGGQDYIRMEGIYFDLISDQIQNEVEKLSVDEKEDLRSFYESNYLNTYLDRESGNYIYTDDDLAYEITGRFKCWVDDNFSLDEMMAEEGVDEDEVNDGPDDDEIVLTFENDSNVIEKINALKSTFQMLISKGFQPAKQKQLQIALINLAYHPSVPDDDFFIEVSFSIDAYQFEITYSNIEIKIQQFYIDEGSVFYEYNFILEQKGYRIEEGDFSSVSHYFELLENMSAGEFCISKNCF